jgi:hypothetical protein
MREPLDSEAAILQELLGYLNFSSGASDPQFLANLDQLYRRIELDRGQQPDTWRQVRSRLLARLDELAAGVTVFSDCVQARAAIELALDHFPGYYREFHRDLLPRQSDAMLWRPFFLGRVLEAVLRQGAPWDETERILAGAQAELDDFIGHRPVAVLRSVQRIEPYAHEWVRPLPLYVRTVGVATGRYERLIGMTLDVLRATDPAIKREAWFDLDLVDELAVDPREYDFDHPVNKRPNYHFGQWDPHHLDNQGRFRRFVLQQVTLDALLSRVDEPGEFDREELLFEAAGVLAGTILMASGTSGSGPDTHASTTTLGMLVPQIAAYRDAYYQQLLSRTTGPHGERLKAEAAARRQPLAGARQHLNHYLARRRAAQLEHVHLSLLFSEMGYSAAALRQTDVVPTASARMRCQIQCCLTGGRLASERGELPKAAELFTEGIDLVHRGIECGALVDPWNILGFQGQFSLFPAPENSVPDHRVDQLIELLEQVFSLAAQLWREASAHNERALVATVSRQMAALAQWWDRFAATTVEGVEAFSGQEAYESARSVAEALEAWHKAGAAAGDVGFWRKHLAHFNSAKAYALVVEALLEKRDFVAAMALLMQWLSQADHLPLQQGEYSFHLLARRWLGEVCASAAATGAHESLAAPEPDRKALERRSVDRQALIRKFFDYLEANADDYGQVPKLELDLAGRTPRPKRDSEEQAADEEDAQEGEADMFDAAYDEMVYVDSTADGVEGDMLESDAGGRKTDYELEIEARRVRDRLALVGTLSHLWKSATLECGTPQAASPLDDDLLARWLEQVDLNFNQLIELMGTIDLQPVRAASATREALIEYDRRRSIKEALLDTAIATAVETADARQMLRSLRQEPKKPGAGAATHSTLKDGVSNDADPIDALCRGVLAGDAAEARRRWDPFLTSVEKQPLLYVSLSRGGDPAKIVAARSLQQMLRDLVRALPRLGLLDAACQLLETARIMENNRSFSAGSVSEFDRLFEAGYKALVESLVDVSRAWPVAAADRERGHEFADTELIDTLEELTESLLKQWLAHSRTLRLSVLEKIADEKTWRAMVDFIERYGHDLLTQKFLNFGNLRAILHQGVDAWLERLQEDPDAADELLLVRDLGGSLKRADAVKHLTIVFEAIVENFAEYRDYNSTTTQSDRGELLYTLLDFLRLRVQYDRIAWHLRPVVLTHEILVRQGRMAAAEMWRRAMAERTTEVADALDRRLVELRKKYGMRLPTIDDRLAERFIRPLAIDRIRALVGPAVEDARAARPSDAFERLEAETDELTQEPTGVGLDVPAWLHALEAEVRQARRERPQLDGWPVPQRPLSLGEISDQLSGWEREPL